MALALQLCKKKGGKEEISQRERGIINDPTKVLISYHHIQDALRPTLPRVLRESQRN